jgi:hypothetical protein
LRRQPALQTMGMSSYIAHFEVLLAFSRRSLSSLMLILLSALNGRCENATHPWSAGRMYPTDRHSARLRTLWMAICASSSLVFRETTRSRYLLVLSANYQTCCENSMSFAQMYCKLVSKSTVTALKQDTSLLCDLTIFCYRVRGHVAQQQMPTL